MNVRAFSRLLRSLLPLGALTLAATPVPTMASAAESHRISPALPRIPAAHFKITDHGAVPDDHTDNTKAIQATIDAAKAAGGGIVEIPAGNYLSGPVTLSSRIALQLDADATLRMLPLDRYPGGTKDPASFISGANLQDIAITGKGTIDGQGEPWWPFAKTKGTNRPRMIALGSCTRILIENVTLKNSPMFHIAISGKSSDVVVRGVTIRAPASTDPVTPSHNTDACDVAGHDILIENCDVSVGDDNFTCGGNTSNVLIAHCTYGYGHGVSIGSYTKGGVSNITVIDCTFNGTEAGIRIKSDRGRGGLVKNLRYENLRMTNVAFPILIYGAYMAEKREYRDLNKLTGAIAATYPSAPVEPLTPMYRDFVFRNITATASPGRRAGLIWGLPEAPATNIVFDNVKITADLPFGIFSAKQVKFTNCSIQTPDGVNKIASSDADVTVSP